MSSRATWHEFFTERGDGSEAARMRRFYRFCWETTEHWSARRCAERHQDLKAPNPAWSRPRRYRRHVLANLLFEWHRHKNGRLSRPHPKLVQWDWAHDGWVVNPEMSRLSEAGTVGGPDGSRNIYLSWTFYAGTDAWLCSAAQDGDHYQWRAWARPLDGDTYLYAGPRRYGEVGALFVDVAQQITEYVHGHGKTTDAALQPAGVA